MKGKALGVLFVDVAADQHRFLQVGGKAFVFHGVYVNAVEARIAISQRSSVRS